MWGLLTHRAKARHGLITLNLIFITQITVAASPGSIRLEDTIDRTLASNPIGGEILSIVQRYPEVAALRFLAKQL